MNEPASYRFRVNQKNPPKVKAPLRFPPFLKNVLVVFAAILIGAAVGAPFAFYRWNGIKEDTAARNSLVAEESTQSYIDGHADGFIVGKADAARHRDRDGIKALKFAKIHGSSYSGDGKIYERGYYDGYNDGWYARMRYSPPPGTKSSDFE